MWYEWWPEVGIQKLTPRQIEVLRLAADGLSHREIARELVISPRTVKNIVSGPANYLNKGLLRALGAKNLAHAVAIGFRLGLLE